MARVFFGLRMRIKISKRINANGNKRCIQEHRFREGAASCALISFGRT